jgi:hypothetical protein
MIPSDDLCDPGPRDIARVWAVGFVGAFGLAAYGEICIYSQSAIWIGRFRAAHAMHCQGAGAIALGIVYLGVAGLLHFHFFWSWRERFGGFAQLGKIMSLLVVAAGAFFFIFHFWFD